MSAQRGAPGRSLYRPGCAAVPSIRSALVSGLKSTRREASRSAVEHVADDAEVDAEAVDHLAHDVDVLAHVVACHVDQRACGTHHRNESHHVARAARLLDDARE